MYREIIESVTKDNQWVKIQPPCSEKEISKAEKKVGYSFPDELKRLLREMNGDNWLLLSAQGIIENVERNRKYFYPLFEEDYGVEKYKSNVDRFIYFATNGCGDYYCYRVNENGNVEDNTIYFWDHENMTEDNCFTKVADNLEDCIRRYYNDEI